MKFNINKIRYILAIIVVLLTFSACKNDKQAAENKSSETKAGGKAEANSEEEMPTIATLSQEQIKIVGIQLGTIEQKELTATIKANGNLKVPNNNKGNATSLYGGVIKMLNVQIGDYVKKGQVIATIANPQFIQLQEEYLSTASKISFAEQELARQKELNEGNAGAKKNLQSATAELNSLRTRRASLQQQIQLMGINPGSVSNSNLKSALVVTSPLNGTVSNVFAKIGDVQKTAILLFAEYIDAATTIAAQSGGGGGGATSGWGRDKDEDELSWAYRCAMMANRLCRPRKKQGYGR